MRIDDLTKHLNNLIAVNGNAAGAYDEDIRNAVDEINKELGIGTAKALSQYSTKELHEELVKRKGVQEITIDNNQEAVFIKIVGEHDEKTPLKGPFRALFNWV